MRCELAWLPSSWQQVKSFARVGICGDLVWGSHILHPLQEELPGAGVDAAILYAWFRGAVSSLPVLPSPPPAAGKTCPGGGSPASLLLGSVCT